MMKRTNKVFNFIQKKQFYFALIICVLSLVTLALVIINPSEKKEQEIADLNDTIEASTEDGLSPLVENEEFELAEDATHPITIAQESVEGDASEPSAQGDTEVETVQAYKPNSSTEEQQEQEQQPQQPQQQPEQPEQPEQTNEEVQPEIEDKKPENKVDTVAVADPKIEEASNIQPDVQPAIQPALSFSDTDNMIWPISGSILLPYSMDKPVYFKTLDQYKINPGILISGEIDTGIKAAADGMVERIEETVQLGYAVILTHGNGWKTIYGQLSDSIKVKEGDYVKQGQVIASISPPSKYYSMLQPHLYFQIERLGRPISPSQIIAQ